MATSQTAQNSSLTGTSGASAYGFNSFTGEQLTQIITEKLSPRVAELANKSSIFFQRIPSKTTPQNPRGLRVAIAKRTNASQIFYGEGGSLSVGDGREFISMNVFYARFSQGSRLTLDALQAMEKGQALETIKDRMKQDLADALRFLNHQGYGNGEGTVGVAAAVVSNNTTLAVTFKAPYYSRFIQLGGRYDLHDGTTKAKQNGAVLTCTAVDVVAGTATFTTTSAIDVAVDDIFVKEGSYGLSIAGLDYLIDDTSSGDIFGIPRNTGNQFRAVVDRSGGALSVAKLNFVVQQFKNKKGADKWNPRDFVILMHPAQFQAYINLGDPTQNATNSGVRLAQTVGNKGLDLGYSLSGVFFQGIDIVEDDACQPDTIYFVNKKDLQKGQFVPLGAYQLPGSNSNLNAIPAFTSGGVGTFLDQAIYYLNFKGNLFVEDVSSHIAIKGLSIGGLATGKV